MNLRMTALLGLAVAGALMLIACDDSTPDPTEARASFCEELDNLESSLVVMSSLGPASSVDDAEAAYDQVKSDFDSVLDAAGDLPEADALESAVDDINSELESLPDDATLQEASTSIQAAVGVASSTRAALESASAECSG